MPFYSKAFKPLWFVILICLLSLDTQGQQLPMGYTQLFKNDFVEYNSLPLWNSNPFITWQLVQNGRGYVAKASHVPDSNDQQIGLSVLDNMVLGDFIVEFFIKLEEYSDTSDKNRSCYFLGALKSNNMYYAFELMTDSVAFYYKNKTRKTKLAQKALPGIKQGQWIKCRIHRDMLTRTFTFVINSNDKHKASFSHQDIVMGHIGFGVEGTSCKVKNMRVWGPTSLSDSTFTW